MVKSLVNISFGFLFLSLCSCSIAQTEVNNKTDSIESNQLDQVNDSTIVFAQLDSLIDDRDGEKYPVIQIGEQIWMGENLRYNAAGSKLNPDNPSTDYGRLYNAITVQTVCPIGWHLPSDWEWSKMEQIVLDSMHIPRDTTSGVTRKVWVVLDLVLDIGHLPKMVSLGFASWEPLSKE